MDWLIENFPSGTSSDFKVLCKGADGVAFDFTGWTLKCRVKRSLADSDTPGVGGPIFTKISPEIELVGGDAAGVVTVHIYADELLAPPAGAVAATIEATKTVGGKALKVAWPGKILLREKA